MSFKQVIQVIDSHTAGDSLRLVTGGVPAVKGSTIKAKIDYLIQNQPRLLKTTMWEPRGHSDMFGALLLDPVVKEADFGLVFFDTGTYYYGMCGHGTIAAATIVVETGMVEYTEPVTNVVFETYDGLVKAAVKVRDREAIEVTITNVPSFLYRESVTIDLDSYGQIVIDISFGGAFFILTPVDQLNEVIAPSSVHKLHGLAPAIKDAVSAKISVSHPELPEVSSEIDVFYYDPVSEETQTYQVLEILASSNQLTRSPCGTGTSALMAMLHKKQILQLNEVIVTRGFLGTEFRGQLISVFADGQYLKVVPEVTGSAFITGFNQLIVKDKDPLGGGFLV